MKKFRILSLSAALCLLCIVGIGRCALRANGRNVKTVYERYSVLEKTSIKVQKSRTTCTRTCTTRFLWCWSKKTVCQTIYYYAWGTGYKIAWKTRTNYVCLPGWAPKGSECTKPICTGGCANNGECIYPETCKCARGWTGSRCRSDINECATGGNRCGYKPGCRNTMGSYTCSCSTGYYLGYDGRSCKDVDECSTGRHSCGKNTKCYNTLGSYKCPCLTGYEPSKVGKSCQDIDECSPSSGVLHNCEMNCNNFPGGYRCSCDEGFVLINGKDCSDHDECSGDGHGCKQLCVNLRGGYKCDCDSGYRVNADDRKSCDDIDECAEDTSGCAHDCTNSIGSFNCSCRAGYTLDKDLKSCIDIDECSKNVDYCHHNCVNTIGSYRCACRPGFDLRIDQKSCRGRPCFPIFSPSHGMKACTGYVTEDKCDFSCLPGYEIKGSLTRTCGSDKQWTGNDTECKIIHCTSPADPSNGFLYWPCSTHYGSECSLGCNSGYYTNISTLTCNSDGIWQPNNVSCKEIRVCEPNPCRNGGTCTAISEDQYKCDCTSTGYMGTHCDVGFFTIPDYPTITNNIPSPPLTIRCSRPTNHVTLNFISEDLQFSPTNLVFKHNNHGHQSIQITAPEEGYYFIRYSLSGPNALDYHLPQEDILFVHSQNSTTVDSSSELPLREFPNGCFKKQLGICPGSNTAIMASSTTAFLPFGPLELTQGMVAIEIDNAKKVPWSLVGLNLPNSSANPFPNTCNGNDITYSVQKLIKQRTLAKSFTNLVADSFPTWMSVGLSDGISDKKCYTSEIKTNFLTGQELRKSTIGGDLPIAEHTFYSLLATRNLNMTINNDSDILNSNSLSMAVDICGKSPFNVLVRPTYQVSFNSLNEISTFKTIEKYGWGLNVTSVQFSRTNNLNRSKKEGLWDGYKYFNINASSDGTFATVSSLKKNFRNANFADITLDFDGTLIGHVNDVNKIMNSPFNQQWEVDLHGRIALNLSFQMEGKPVSLTLNGPEGSVGFARFGGGSDDDLQESKKGLFFKTRIDHDPFANSHIKHFVDASSTSTISCFLNTKLYSERDNQPHIEKTDHFSCAFPGNLKIASLKFDPMNVNLVIGPSEQNVELYGTYIKSQNVTFGIFKRHSNSCGNVRFSFQKRSPTYSGSFCAFTTIFGMEELVHVGISHDGLKFEVNGKLYSLFEAKMIVSAKSLSWKNQVFDVDGEFITNGNGNQLADYLKMELDSYAMNFVSQATKRLAAFSKTVKRAHARLVNVKSLRDQAFRKHQQLISEYTLVTEELETVQKYLAALEITAATYSQEFQQLKQDLESLCAIKHCPKVCQEGVSCTACYEDITASTMGMCPATCSRTEQRQVPPYTEIALCDRPSCKRIHRKRGLFQTLFGDTFGGLLRDAFSFGTKAVLTWFGAPPSLAVGISEGLTTLLDTGRLGVAICTGIKSGLRASGLALDKFNPGIDELDPYLEKVKVSDFLKCPKRQTRDGYWKCDVRTVQCEKGRYQYEYTDSPYLCKKSCVIKTISDTIEKSCCSNVPCAVFVVNVTCIAENVLCKKARIDALEKVSSSKSQAQRLLNELESAKSNYSYWNMREQKTHVRLMRQRRWLNTTENTVRSLEKAHNSSIESKREVEKLLSAPLESIKSLLNEQNNSIDKIRLTNIRFKTKVSAKGNDNTLLPIDISFDGNGTLHQISTVLDFARLNVSVKSISQEILREVIGKSEYHSRSKRSTDNSNSDSDLLLVQLKKFHTHCAKFTNYHQILQKVASSLYNLSSETLTLESSLESSKFSVVRVPNLELNKTSVDKFGLNDGNYSGMDYLKYDPEMSEAIDLQQERIEETYEVINASSRLLIYNWLSTMEDMFNSSGLLYECSGMNDCMIFVLDSLLDIFSLVEVNESNHIREQIEKLKISLDHLSNSLNATLVEAKDLSQSMLTILDEMREMKVVCAQFPNITKHPNSFTELGIGQELTLKCNATGTAILFSWTFNGDVLQGQTSKELKIRNVTSGDSGSYTCEVSNHIAKERSIPAVVVVHPPPIIVTQPEKYLAIVVSGNDFLQCDVDENAKNVSYQWWFKSANSSKSFSKLSNETFPYIDFSPMKTENEGWYFCQVSNFYGTTTSQISFVKALAFTLPVPTAVLSFSLNRKTVQLNSSVHSLNSTWYDLISSKISRHILSEKNFSAGVHVENLRPINCQLRKRYSDKNISRAICSWEFQYVGRNVTTNVSHLNNFERNAGMVINASQELTESIGSLVNATNNGSLSFPLAGYLYFVEKNTVAVHKFSLTCPRNQVLIQTDFQCVDCPPGYYAGVGTDQETSCIPCPVEFYQTDAGKTYCNPCPKLYTTWETGSYEYSQCKAICQPGSYSLVPQGTVPCLTCPLNTYQPYEGQSECLRCPENHITQAEGAKDSNQCIFVTKNISSGKPTQLSKTTDTVHEESDGDNGDKIKIIAVVIGCLIGAILVIGVCICFTLRRRASKLKAEHSHENQRRAGSDIVNNEQCSSTHLYCDIDKRMSVCSSRNGNEYETPEPRYVDLDTFRKGETSEKKASTTSDTAFNNPAFYEMPYE